MVELHKRAKMTKKEIMRFLVLRSLGNFLLLFALYGVAMTFGPVLMEEAKFRIAQAQGITYKISSATPKAVNDAEVTPSPTQDLGSAAEKANEKVLVPPDTNFSIVIPKIGASSRVIPNVDPTDEKEFLPALAKGVAHAKGTVFPGMDGTVYLFAHSTDNWWNVGRYNAVFYLLKELSPGDQIVVFFENRRYNYYVDEKVIKDASDVSYLINSQSKGKQELVLQTCWPPGTTWKRLFVIATPR